LVGGYGTSVTHMLAMAFEGPTMDDDLHEPLAAQVIVLGEEWADGRPVLAWSVPLRAMWDWNNG
jgi:hypothetical protein